MKPVECRWQVARPTVWHPGSPEDIAGVVVIVSSDDGRYVAGAEIWVDGGVLI